MGDVFKWVLTVLLLLAVAFGLMFVTGTMGNLYDSTVTRQHLNVERKNFEETAPYVQNKNDLLNKMWRSYVASKDPEEKRAICDVVLSEMANFDLSKIQNQQVKSFVMGCGAR